MIKYFISFALSTFLLVSPASAGVLTGVTVKAVSLDNIWGHGVLNVKFNEPVVIDGCALSNGWQSLAYWEATALGPWINAWMSMLMSAQAQDMKVDIYYTGCGELFGANITRINMRC